jgi:hypothetical protein
MFILGLLFLPGLLSAQQTILVDAAGGGDFTDIQPAVFAADPGDIIRVRHGVYGPVTVSRSLRILGDRIGSHANDLVVINGALQLTGLARDESLVIAGLRATSVSVVSCLGDVYLSNLIGPLLVSSSSFVTLDEYTGTGGFTFAVNILDSRVVDMRGRYISAVGPALNLERSFLTMVDTKVVAGIFSIGPGEAASIVTDSQVNYSAGTTLSTGGNPPGPGYELRGENKAWRAAHTVLVDRDWVGTKLEVKLLSDDETPFVVLGFSDASRPLRIGDGELYLDFESLQLLHAGLVPPGVPRSKILMLPPDFARENGWLGIPVTFQAAVLDGDGMLSFSQPYTVVL